MRKYYAFLLGMFTLVACSDSNPSSATNNAPSSYDIGEGYTIAIPFKYDEATGIAYQGTSSCYYHSDSKSFTWEENIEPLTSKKLIVKGDSLWMGPIAKSESDDPNVQMTYDTYNNIETLTLSNNHNGIYGTWNVTGCTRKLGETEINCSKFIAGLSGIARTLTYTKDSVYMTTIVDLNNVVEQDISFGSILDNYMGFDIGDLIIDSLGNAQVIKQLSKQPSNPALRMSFSVSNQVFEIDGYAKFDSSGMNYFESISSNGKTCTKHERLSYIDEKTCKEESAEILLSARDKYDEESYYKEGPVESIVLDNREEFKNCSKELVTEETKNLLNPYSRHNN